MPVNIGNNLTLKNTDLSGTYGELFKKLNVAYGWTHTQTTSEGGTAVALVNNGDILTTEECNDINQCSIGHGVRWNTGYYWSTAIINGKIYYYNGSSSGSLVRVGSKSDYIICTGFYNYTSTYCPMHAIDSSGKLWYLNYNEETQIGTDTTWTDLGYIYTGGYDTCAIKDGKLYMLHATDTPEQKCTSLTNITKLAATSYGNKIYGYCINNGYLYYISGDVLNMVGSDNNWKNIYLYNVNNGQCIVTNSNDELFFVSSSSLYKQNISNAKKATSYSSGTGFCLTNDGKLYYCRNLTNIKDNNYGTYYDISNNITWTDISTQGYSPYIYAIGDGKLYKIKVSNDSNPIGNTTYTQIGTEENYQKVEGIYYGSTNNYCLGIAWTGDATTVTHTVLTTKIPQANDAVYIDEDLNQYSTVQSTTTTTITDEYRTYNRDVSKDTSFTAIPPATVHETLSTIDFLRITNPNT